MQSLLILTTSATSCDARRSQERPGSLKPRGQEGAARVHRVPRPVQLRSRANANPFEGTFLSRRNLKRIERLPAQTRVRVSSMAERWCDVPGNISGRVSGDVPDRLVASSEKRPHAFCIRTGQRGVALLRRINTRKNGDGSGKVPGSKGTGCSGIGGDPLEFLTHRTVIRLGRLDEGAIGLLSRNQRGA